MLRALIYAVSLLHLGPGLAFALLAFGCEQPQPLLGSVCTLDVFKAFGSLTLGSWLVLGVGAVAMHLVSTVRRTRGPATAVRGAAFAALICCGVLLGASWQMLTGSQYLYLAVPAALALGWLFVANPVECACVPEVPTQESSGPGA